MKRVSKTTPGVKPTINFTINVHQGGHLHLPASFAEDLVQGFEELKPDDRLPPRADRGRRGRGGRGHDYDDLDEILRGQDMGKVLAVGNQVIPYGQHVGHTWQWVIDSKPSYGKWVISHPCSLENREGVDKEAVLAFLKLHIFYY